MKETRIQQLPIKNFEYIFSPPGLPLVVKGAEGVGTTSILIRGGAGTGKTTLATALAHAIARENGGLVLYVTTEFSPAEIAYKATLLGLTEEAVSAWPGAPGAVAGAIVVQHLSVLASAEGATTSAEKKKSALDAVWELLHSEGEKPPVPIRAVVLDAFGLPDKTEDGPALRSDLIAFVQALESDGICTVLVEELAGEGNNWLPFVMDVVCELQFVEDPDTLELRRKLRCTKSRYASTLPGPHDYGLEDGTPCTWPDLLRVITSPFRSKSQPASISPVRMMVPSSVPEQWAYLAGGIVISSYDKIGLQALNAIERTPGIREISVSCGPQTVITNQQRTRVANDHEGPHAIGWSILNIAQAARGNYCVFSNIDGFLTRNGWQVPILHMLTALRDLGLLVVIHSPLDGVKSIEPIANIAWKVGKVNSRVARPRNHRPAARWVINLELGWNQFTAGSTSLRPKSDSALQNEPDSAEALSKSFNVIGPSLKNILLSSSTELATYVLLLAADHIGIRSGVLERFKQFVTPSNSSAPFFPIAAWLALSHGAEWHAAYAVLEALSQVTVQKPILLLWAAICATQAGNASAIDILKAKLDQPEAHLILDPLVRSLAAAGRLTEADEVIQQFAAQHTVDPWMLDRLLADARLDASGPDAVRDAAERLEKLAGDGRLPLLHCAEVCHNLGVAKDRLGDREAAIRWFQRARELNPYLEASVDELTKLGVSPPAPSAT